MDITQKLEYDLKSYKRKKVLMNYVIPVVLTIVTGAVWFFYSDLKFEEKTVPLKSVKKEAVTKSQKPETIFKKIEKETKRVGVIKKPILSKEKKPVMRVEDSGQTIRNDVVLEADFTFKKMLQTQKKKSSKSVIQKVEQKPEPLIIKRKVADPVGRLIKKFEEEPSCKAATEVAEELFKNRLYEKALEWAMKANELDSSQEESWIVFVKASIQLGRVEVALKAIDAYLKNHSSKELSKIKEEIFR